MAPKPVSKPSITVPTTMRRARHAVKLSDRARACGRGILESTNRYSPTGIRLNRTLGTIRNGLPGKESLRQQVHV